MSKNIDFNIDFATLYKHIETTYINDKEFTEEIVFILSEHAYREELLLFLKLREFDQTIINNKIMFLFKIIKDNGFFNLCIEQIKNRLHIDDNITAFMILFSYDYFYLIYPCISDFLDLDLITHENERNILSIFE